MIYYVCPDWDEPSWGVGTLYCHVRLLAAAGIGCSLVHQRRGFRLSWLEEDAPARYLEDGFEPCPQDILVVPEVLASRPEFQARCRRFVFVQNPFLIHASLGKASDYQALGFERALVTQPCIQNVVERHYGVPASLIPLQVADYFFDDEPATRCRRVLLIQKPAYEQAGLPDHAIARGRLPALLPDGWEFLEVFGRPHRQVAQLMRTSAFLVSLNSLEGFNVTVPEAMAAGCIPVCYDAFGGIDYLEPDQNAYVFGNHHLFPLLDKVAELTHGYERLAPELSRVRQAGRRTAEGYRLDRVQQELLTLFRGLEEGQPERGG